MVPVVAGATARLATAAARQRAPRPRATVILKKFEFAFEFSRPQIPGSKPHLSVFARAQRLVVVVNLAREVAATVCEGVALRVGEVLPEGGRGGRGGALLWVRVCREFNSLILGDLGSDLTPILPILSRIQLNIWSNMMKCCLKFVSKSD